MFASVTVQRQGGQCEVTRNGGPDENPIWHLSIEGVGRGYVSSDTLRNVATALDALRVITRPVV